jgi:hypothetical protein
MAGRYDSNCDSMQLEIIKNRKLVLTVILVSRPT